MTKIDTLAKKLRDAYGIHCGEKWRPWSRAAPEKREAWRAIAKTAMSELGADA